MVFIIEIIIHFIIYSINSFIYSLILISERLDFVNIIFVFMAIDSLFMLINYIRFIYCIIDYFINIIIISD